MYPVVTMQTFDISPHPMGRGRFLSVDGQYLYSLLCDPFVLSKTRALPIVRLVGEPIDKADDVLLLYSEPTTLEDNDHLREVASAGGRIVLNRPEDGLFADLSELAKFGGVPEIMISLRERWDLGPLAGRTYYYTSKERFLLLDADKGKALSRIGDNPDLMLLDRLALFAGNPLGMITAYRTAPYLGQLLLDLASLLAQLVAQMAGSALTADQEQVLAGNGELRRDFHSFGFAYLTVQELDRCYGGGQVDLGGAEALAIEAAGMLANGNPHEAQQSLRLAFKELERENRKLQPTPAVFTDTLHGGGLFSDLGYFEFDWPQHPADVLRNHLYWAKERSYRFNVDFGASCVKYMARRFPRLFADLKLAQEQGLVEFVNGTMGQPYPPFFSVQSQIRQITDGNAIMEEVLGQPVRVYASQEFGFCPQLASILAQSKYEAVVLRTQHLADPPTLSDERIIWAAPNGDAIQALPSHPYKSEQQNGVTYNDLHLKIYAHQETGLSHAVFSGFGDVDSYRPFREELLRSCHYSQVFGKFSTWSEYFSHEPSNNPPKRCFDMADFNCRASFMDIEGAWGSDNRAGTGHANSSCMRSMETSNLFIAAEMLDAVGKASGQLRPPTDEQIWSWEALTVYQSHDVYIAPYYKAGSFLGGVINHVAASTGQVQQNVAEYCGPWDYMLTMERAEVDMDKAQSGAAKSIAARMRNLCSASSEHERYVLFNPGPSASKVVRIKNAGGKSLTLHGNAVACQAAGKDALVLVDLPTCGYLILDSCPEQSASASIGDAGVSVGNDYLENSQLRAQFDLEQGTIKSLIRKSDGQNLLSESSREFYLPDGLGQRCRKARIIDAGPLRGSLEFDIEVGQTRSNRARIRSVASLEAGQSLLKFQEHILRCPEIRGDHWKNHLAARFRLTDPEPKLIKCHSNILERAAEGKVFSRNLLLAGTKAGGVIFVNYGNQFYSCQGSDICNILICEQEPGREFAYALGIAQSNPIIQARSCVQPVFVQKLRAKAGASLAADDRSVVSFFSVDSPDVEVLSCRFEDGLFRLRLANTTDRKFRAKVRTFCRLKQAILTDFRGNRLEDLDIHKGLVDLDMRPWDIREIALEPSTQTSPNS